MRDLHSTKYICYEETLVDGNWYLKARTSFHQPLFFYIINRGKKFGNEDLMDL